MFRDGIGEGGNYQPMRDAISGWTTAHKLMGQATVGAILNHPGPERFGKVFPKGPHTLIQAEVRASLVRNGAGALVYSENPAWCIRDYLTHRDGWRIPAQWIDDASFAGFAALCDQPVALKAGGTEARYRLSGHYALSDAPKDVMGRMLATCDGQVYMTAEGKIGILGGEWTEPDVVITSDDILEFEAADGFDPFTDFNVLKGKFTSPAHGYQPTEVPERRDTVALATEPERVETIEIDMCPSGTQMRCRVPALGHLGGLVAVRGTDEVTLEDVEVGEWVEAVGGLELEDVVAGDDNVRLGPLAAEDADLALGGHVDLPVAGGEHPAHYVFRRVG